MSAILLDGVVLSAFLWVKVGKDPLVVIVSLAMIVVVFASEKWFLSRTE
jgi:hypothetical protein